MPEDFVINHEFSGNMSCEAGQCGGSYVAVSGSAASTVSTEGNQMPRGGFRPGSGRKPGAVSSRTADTVRFMAPLGEQALGVLVEAMRNPKAPWSCRIQAASILCDRAYGRAPQSVSLDVTRRLNDMSLAELLQLESKLVAEQRLIDLAPAEPVSPSDESRR
jgi:hypothetical protein